ncbi:MAG: ferrous iron transport protein B [Bacteroidota bacterium]
MSIKKIALIGNPNSGKTSLFNHLTGLNQHVGNYPGVTVDKKIGYYLSPEQEKIEVLDLPGVYSVFPKSEDEKVVYDVLENQEHEDYPDLVIVIVDASNLERNLLLFSQVYDLKVPVLLAVNMVDISEAEGRVIDYKKLSELLSGVPIVPINALKGKGLEDLKKAVFKYENGKENWKPFLEDSFILNGKGKHHLNGHYANGHSNDQIKDTQTRYKRIDQILSFVINKDKINSDRKKLTRKIDSIVTHPIWGFGIFLFILFIIFQMIYSVAEIPMDLIDGFFGNLSSLTLSLLPSGSLTRLFAEGIIPGIGGIVVFIPQILLLFLFIAILEESGYMSRVVFIMDRIMRPFGLNGKSVVPLISGVACAIPAIMATRTINQWKDRLVTIMVTPLMSCSARLPVYSLLIALVVPDTEFAGIINMKGLALLGMYLLGVVAALGAAVIFKWILKAKEKSFLVMELPLYRTPRWKNMMLTLVEKIKIFVFEAGKVILAISIVLWVLASYGPREQISKAVQEVSKTGLGKEEYEQKIATVKLENSWIGILGKKIEPTIKPLGFNWQIGIALITSFAAREVFVGSMATIYSVGQDLEDEESLIQRMSSQKDPDTGERVYNLASGFSLMVFYAFAMQCMSTIAIVYRETKSWKWPLIQLFYMTGLAYIGSLITYNLLS